MTATSAQRRAKYLRRAHGIAALGWAAMIPVSVISGLRNSVPYLVGISVYALAIGHGSSWQGSRAETKDDDC